MLDELLGRAALKARIEELQEERTALERRLDAESERRADAVSARQDAEERVNRLEDRIADLEGRLERAGDEEAALEFRGRADLNGARLEEVLARLRSFETGPEGALTAMVDSDPPPAVADAFDERSRLVAGAAPCLALADDAGLVSVALTPPLAPAPFAEWGEHFRLDDAWFRPTGRLAFAVVRSDRFAVGVYEGEDRRDVETVETDVMNNHSKGGFSQARFERRRDEQVAAHVEACRAVLDRRAADAETVVVVGQRTLLDEFEDVADRTAPADATGDPEAALAEAFRSFFTTRLYRV